MFKPFKIIPVIKYQFLVFLGMILILGHIGLFFGYLVVKDKESISIYMVELLKNGTFYNMGISFLASAMFPVVVEFIDSPDAKFKGLKIVSIIFSFIAIIIYAVLFPTEYGKTQMWAVIQQSICYLIAIFLALYLFLVGNLDKDYENYIDLDDRKRKEIIEKSGSVQRDGRGAVI
jgi:hypothetical protein